VFKLRLEALALLRLYGLRLPPQLVIVRVSGLFVVIILLSLNYSSQNYSYMKIALFLVLIVISVALAIHADNVEDSTSGICIGFVAAAIFLLAFYLPSKLMDKDTKH